MPRKSKSGLPEQKGIPVPEDDLTVCEFKDIHDLHAWLVENHHRSGGIWIRLHSKRSTVPSVTFEDVLDEGLCFGWSESKRRGVDRDSYLQRFTPRKTQGTRSARNLQRINVLIKEGRMTPAGFHALGMYDQSQISK
jgi:uncharacterized protein YdeI (YjbR/CyaY-like superfamily)